MSLGEKLKQLRSEKGWSQDEFAYHADVDGRQLSRYENDHVKPSIEVVMKMANAFNVSLDYLLYEDIPRRPLRIAQGRIAERVFSIEKVSEEDERCLLHMIETMEAKNKLKAFVSGIR